MKTYDFEKILVIQTAFLGDLILTTPLIRELSILFPEAAIDVLTIPGTQIILKYNPYINRSLVFNKNGIRNKTKSFRQLVGQFRKTNYEIAISAQSSLTSALLMRQAGIPMRIGFDFQKFLTTRVPYEQHLHTRERYLKLLSPFSENQFDSHTEIFWSDVEEEKASQLFNVIAAQHPFTIGVAPGSVWFTKMWPPEYYVGLIRRLAWNDVGIVLLGGKAERELCNHIAQQAGVKVYNMAGILNILESTALIKKLHLLVTNDSAPMHIANAVQTDVLAVFGPTVKEFGFYPYRKNDRLLEVNLDCRPCGKHGGRYCPHGHFQCMRLITPKYVHQIASAMLDARPDTYTDKWIYEMV